MWIEYQYKSPYGASDVLIYESIEATESDAIFDLKRRIWGLGDIFNIVIYEKPPARYCEDCINAALQEIALAEAKIKKYQDLLNDIQK